MHAGDIPGCFGGQILQADHPNRQTDYGAGKGRDQLVHQTEKRADCSGNKMAGFVGFVVRTVGDHRDGHVSRCKVGAVSQTEEKYKQGGVEVNTQLQPAVFLF